MMMQMVRLWNQKLSLKILRLFTTDDADTFGAIGEEFLAGFFEDETTKKPVVAAVAAVAPVVTQAPVVVPAKVPTEVLTNEIVPAVAGDATLAVVPVEAVATGEKVAETATDLETAATMPEKVEVMPETVNEVLPVVEGEILEPAASEIVVAEAPAVVTQAVTVAETPVAAVAATPVKATSEEEEGLIEGIVNTLISDDDADGEHNICTCT